MRLALLLAGLLAAAAATNHTLEVDKDSKNNTKEILKASETADPSKVEIVKQIRRLNNDGSYTIGYEADDGTFKIENRDVRGNVKGTFGYVDQDGEIKRVTYSSSSDSTPTPVPVSTTTTTSTPSSPMMIIRMNKTVSSSSTTRRPLGTIVYPTRTAFTTRGTVIQPIPRSRRPGSTTKATDATTEKQMTEESTSNILNLYKPKTDDIELKRTKPTPAKDDLIPKQTTTDRSNKAQTLKPVYEKSNEKEVNKSTIRRELTGTSSNPHMIHLRQSVGDDSTDVYGSHLSMGTVRPLFTTTTPRPRLVPIHSLVAARERIQQQYQQQQQQGQDEQETTIEASTGRVFDQENVVTSNPVPVVHIQPVHRDQGDERFYQQPIYRRPPATVHFRTTEYLRDNPGAAIPIGNQRPYTPFEYQNKVFEPNYQQNNQQQAKSTVAEPVTQPYPQQYQQPNYDVRPVTRIVPIPVDDRGVPIQGYQTRFVNPYRQPTQQPPPPVPYQPSYIEPAFHEMTSISTPVSTRDLKRLLQILIIRQNRLQALMDQLMANDPRYHPLPMIRQQQIEYQRPQQVRYQVPRYQEDDRYDYRYEQDRQQDVYYNQVYDSQYENQRFMPRRKLYTRPVYDTAGSSSNHIEESPEYLPPDVREALLLKMLMLAISPDFMPTPPPVMELTTVAPPRKQVRNIQILGEEGSMDEMKRNMRH